MEVSTVDIHNEVSDLTTVDSGLYQHLVRLLGLSSRDRDISILVGYRQKIATLAVRDAWSQDSFIEDYVRRTDLDLYVVFGKLLRENPSAL